MRLFPRRRAQCHRLTYRATHRRSRRRRSQRGRLPEPGMDGRAGCEGTSSGAGAVGWASMHSLGPAEGRAEAAADSGPLPTAAVPAAGAGPAVAAGWNPPPVAPAALAVVLRSFSLPHGLILRRVGRRGQPASAQACRRRRLIARRLTSLRSPREVEPAVLADRPAPSHSAATDRASP